MICQILVEYLLDRKFIVQLIVSTVVYFSIRFIQFICYRIERQSIFKKFGIPGPRPRFLDGHFGLYGKLDRGKRTIFKIEEKISQKYGKFYGVFIGDEPSIICTDLDVLKKIFFEETKSFTERTVMFLDIPLSKGVLFAKFPRWKAMRKYLSPSFSKYTIRGSSHTQFIEDSLKLMIDYIDRKLIEAKTSDQQVNIDIHDLMKATALHLISEMAIRLPDVEVKEGEKNVQSLDSFLSNSDKGVIGLTIICPLFKPITEWLAHHVEHNAALARIFRGLNKVIDEGLKNLGSGVAESKSGDQHMQVIDLMIKLHRDGKMSRNEVLANAESILFAGYDTTSTTMTYIFWVLSKYPEIQEKLRSAVIAHGLNSTYLEQVIKETMRLYPTVTTFTTRVATETVRINRWLIPKGAKVVYNAWLMSRNPEIWPEPERFDPERFKMGLELHPCAYAPFGLGDRLCLGYQLAWLEIKMITCDILLRYRTKLISPQNLEIVSYAVTLTKPRDKVRLEFEKL